MTLADDSALDGLEGEQLQFALFTRERSADAAREYRLGVDGMVAQVCAMWAPPRKLKVSEWADQFRQLPPEDSAEPGQWRTSRAEFQRDIMDSFNDPRADTVVWMASSQVGKTACELSIAGYVMHQDPGPMLVLQPTKEMAEVFSKERLDPMIRDTPVLAELMGDARSRDKKQTIFRKQFPGGQIGMVGTNSPAGLASRPIRVVLADEVDRYPPSAGDEGDPLTLAFKRTTTFWNRKKFVVSTPTVKGASRIATLYEQSDQRRWNVTCEDCGHEQVMEWAGVKWTDGDPATAMYACAGCGVLWDDAHRRRVVNAGRWVATAPFAGIIGFHINQLASPFVTLADCVREFLEAKRTGVQALKAWTNTVLGEVWEESGERVDDNELMRRRVDYGVVAPAPVQVVTAGVDVQKDRLELELVGWAPDDVSYGLGKTVLWGDPGAPEVWQQLDEILQARVAHETHTPLKVMAAVVDSQYKTQVVASFCRDRWGRRVWAGRGVSGEGKPIWPKKPGKRDKSRLPFFNIGVDTAKETIYARLRVQDRESPGYCYFNKEYDEEHFTQLTAEEVRVKYVRGIPQRAWHLKPGHKRNEALDIRVYALAALEGLKLMGLKLRHEERPSALLGEVEEVKRQPTKDELPATEVAAMAAKRKGVKRSRKRQLAGAVMR